MFVDKEYRYSLYAKYGIWLPKCPNILPEEIDIVLVNVLKYKNIFEKVSKWDAEYLLWRYAGGYL